MALGACGSLLNNYTASETQPATLSQAILSDLSDKIPTDRINTLPRQKAAEGIKALEQNNLPAASAAFNHALRMDVQNSYLQFLNALTYHLMAVHGNGENFPLAEQGYTLAAQFDKSNWLAPFYHGLLYVDQKQWREAQEQFARAALIKPDDPDVLYQLAQASYYAGQPDRAYAILSRLGEQDKEAKQSPRTARGLAVTTAALGRFADAEKHLASYQDVANDAESVSQLRARLEGWKDLYDAMDRGRKSKQQPRRQSQFIEPDSSFAQPDRQPDGPESVPPQAAFAETDMVMVDVVLIGTEADEADTRGLNLLSGLRLQFGNPLAPNPAALSVSWNRTKDHAVAEGGLSDVRTLIRAIQIPSISYSLNIFNADDSRSEIIAKPTLTALVGEPSKFFSGVDVNAAAVSGAAGDSVAIQKQIGVSLEVTPQLLPNDMVKLKVKAERTFLTTPSQSVVFQFRLDTTKTSVDANVAMKFGQTLLLSGLMERADETHRDGVPGLQDVPVVQYAFSQRQKREYSKSVLILLTPRRPNYFGGVGVDGMRGGKLNDKRPAYGKSPHMGSIDQFERRYRHWFALPPNYVSIFRHLQFSQVYNEFRTGDFELERWDYSQPHSRRLKRALRYLYY